MALLAHFLDLIFSSSISKQTYSTVIAVSSVLVLLSDSIDCWIVISFS